MEVQIMIRKIISIDEEKCNGCGACASACHEGANGMEGGKAIEQDNHHCLQHHHAMQAFHHRAFAKDGRYRGHAIHLDFCAFSIQRAENIVNADKRAGQPL